jgi:hypothetical protein
MQVHAIRRSIEESCDTTKLRVVNFCETHGRTSVSEVPKVTSITTPGFERYYPKAGSTRTYDVTNEWCRTYITA